MSHGISKSRTLAKNSPEKQGFYWHKYSIFSQTKQENVKKKRFAKNMQIYLYAQKYVNAS